MMKLIEKYRIYGFKLFLSFALKELNDIFWTRLIIGSYSQGREDLIIDDLLKNKRMDKIERFLKTKGYKKILDNGTNSIYFNNQI